MACHTKVHNLTSGKNYKRSRANDRIEQGLSAWVQEGFTIRDLSLTETFQVRAHKSRLGEPLPSKEIPGVIERMPRSEIWTSAVKFELLVAARELCQCST